jgi:hypothetical protein
MEKRGEILLVPSQPLLKDRLFAVDETIRSLEISKPLIDLRDDLKTKGFDIKTIDMSGNLKDAYAVVFFEVPKTDNPYLKKCLDSGLDERLYVMVGEPPAVYPDDHDPAKHGIFRRIMTFNSDMVDGKKYFRLDYTLPIRRGDKIQIPKRAFETKKLLCLISSNKFSSYGQELYGERVKAIRFMERNHPEDFDLYGTGWDKPILHSRLASKFKINGAIWRFWPKGIGIRQFKSYRGSPKDKSEVLPGYRFSIAYENCITRGYISEKILEAMFYGTVPIYLGDPDVGLRIPKGCFIDKREYKDYEDLYRKLKGMDAAEHEGYLANIEKFLNSDKIYPFTIDAFIESFERMLSIGDK